MKRVIIAVVIGAAVFGIASAVQASIPDSQGIVHACYKTTNLTGYPIGSLRARDTATIQGQICSPTTEAPVDLATPQYVQNVVTSTINQTSFMASIVGILSPGQWVGNIFCPTGYVGTDMSIGATDQSFLSASYFTVQNFFNAGQVSSGVPDGHVSVFFNLTGSPSVTAHTTCVDGRVFGQAGPVLSIGSAEAKTTGSFKAAS